jgi:hypothetical protein
METSDFTTTILVDQTPTEVFKDIKNVRGWWSEGIEGATDKLNDEFVYHYKDIHYCKLKMIELVPDQKVVWMVGIDDSRFKLGLYYTLFVIPVIVFFTFWIRANRKN